jgi:hypothetical protein
MTPVNNTLPAAAAPSRSAAGTYAVFFAAK